MRTLLLTIALLSSGLQMASSSGMEGVSMTAKIHMAGRTGTVVFDATEVFDVYSHSYSPALKIDITGDIRYDYDVVELWSLPAVFGRSRNAAEVCSSGIGMKIRDLVRAKLPNPMTGLAESEYFHRSVLLRSSKKRRLPLLCGTILPTDLEMSTSRAKFMGPVVGTVWARYVKSSPSRGVFFYGKLTAGNGPSTDYSSKYELKMLRGGGQFGKGKYSKLCHDFKGYKSRLYTDAGLTVDVHDSVTAEGDFGLYASLASLSNNLLLMNGREVVACAQWRKVEAKTAVAVMDWEGVEGYFKFTQASPFDETQTTVHLAGLKKRASGYHVHKFPAPQRLSASENRCNAPFTSGHFNPYGVDVTKSPAPGTGTGDEYEIGDLSGKYGTLAGKNSLGEVTYDDFNLPLWGPNSIVGRSVVIHNLDGSRLMCGNIGYPSEVVTGIAVFKSPSYGTMYFRQDKNNPDGDTSVFVELANQDSSTTLDHNWHVHVYPVDDDAYTSTDRCQSAGPHYNPSQVSVVDPPYKSECRLEDPLRCELGDLSGRLGKINVVSTLRTEAGKFFYTDEYLHLSGPYSVLDRSVVVHGPEAAAARYACANITQLRPIVAKTDSSWVGASGSARGTVMFEQETEFDLTKVTGSFSRLYGKASGYHIHKYTISTTAKHGSECEEASVAGHYNPFSWTAPVEAVTDTYDRYEVGDLSNKYGLLDGESKHTIQDNSKLRPPTLTSYRPRFSTIRNKKPGPAIMDSNLPLFTFLSSTDKSIVIHKKGGSRWKCANMYTEPPAGVKGYSISATVTFSTVVRGTIKLRQVIYEDGGSGLTSLEVDVSPRYDGSNSNQHNWHIHVEPITAQDSCAAAAGHYDPYGAANIENYPAGCSQMNPLLCEVGDLSNKQEKYDIGGGRRAYHDVDVPLHTNYTVLGRSIVFHVEDGGAARYTCANIIPDDYTYTLGFSAGTMFTRYSYTKAIADALGINRQRVIILHNIDVPVVKGYCAKVMVHIAGGGSISAHKLKKLVAGFLPGLEGFRSTNVCPSEIGATALGQQSDEYVKSYGNWYRRYLSDNMHDKYGPFFNFLLHVWSKEPGLEDYFRDTAQ